jgi:3-oxoacyl-[acyl-carrier protein] reductase
MHTFKDRVVIVTGASRGIGRAIATRLVAEQVQVIGTASKPISKEQEIEGVRFVSFDFGDSKQLEECAAFIRGLPRLDALINNAGINRIKPLDEVSAADFDDVLAVDLRAPYRLCQAAAAVMSKAGSGRIVNIASIWSAITKPKRTLYTTAKTGLTGLTRALAAELGPKGILVNSISPGFVLTDLTRQSLSPEEIQAINGQIPCGRMAQPEEIAELAAFLVGPKNTYLTGQNLIIDGGFTIV